MVMSNDVTPLFGPRGGDGCPWPRMVGPDPEARMGTREKPHEQTTRTAPLRQESHVATDAAMMAVMRVPFPAQRRNASGPAERHASGCRARRPRTFGAVWTVVV